MKYIKLMPMLVISMTIGSCAPTPPPNSKGIDEIAAAQQVADPMEAGFQSLADEIVASLRSQQATKVAVVPFQDLNGLVSEFGGFLAEEMTTRLYRAGTFQVIERGMLTSIMAEHELTMSGLVDEAAATQLGKLLGVDALATGTVTDLGTGVRVNSRLIAAETGSVFAVAAMTLAKDDRIASLMSKPLVIKQEDGIASLRPPASPPVPAAAAVHCLEGTPQTWVGSWEDYKMVLHIEEISGLTFFGKLHWPSIGNSFTEIHGTIVRGVSDVLEQNKWSFVPGFEKDPSSCYLKFKETRLLQGGGVALGGWYFAKVTSSGEMRGVYFRGANASGPTGGFAVYLKE